MKNIRIACWSLGKHAQTNILPALQRTDAAELRGVYTRDTEVLRRVREEYGCIAYENENQLLQDSEVAAVYISSPASEHYIQVKRCLEAGKSVLIEKTAFPELHEAEELVKIANDRQLVIMEAFMYRFHSQFSTLSQIVKEQYFGSPIRIDIQFGFPHLQRPNIRYDLDLAGGALLDAGAYTISAARNLVGDNLSLHSACTFSEPGFDVDTRGNAMFFINQTTVTCAWAFGGAYRNQINIWTPERNIYTDRIFSKSESYDATIELTDTRGGAEVISIGRENQFINMLEKFSSAAKSPQTSGENSQLINQARVIYEVRSRASIG